MNPRFSTVSRILIAVTPAMILLVMSSSAPAQPQYHLIDLGTLGGSGAQAYGISQNGVVAGYAEMTFPPGGSPAVLWDRDASIVSLGVPPGDFVAADAVAVNNVGQVAAYGAPSAGAYVTFLWENGTWTELPRLSGMSGCLPEDINNAGQIAGRSYISGSVTRAALWDQGAVTDLGTLGPDTDAVAYGINDAGQIVGYSFGPGIGYRPFIWQDGVMSEMGLLPSRVEGQAQAINDRGDAAGFSWYFVNLIYAVARATLWRDCGEQIVDLGRTPAGLPGP